MTASSSNPAPEANEGGAGTPQSDLEHADHPRLGHCPRCEYTLIGRPAGSYRCPECGFEYDAFSRDWQDSNPRSFKKLQTLWARGIALVLLLTYFIFTAVVLDYSSGPGAFLRPFAGVLALGQAVWLWLEWKCVHARAFVAITPQGITYRLCSTRIKKVPWKDVLDVRFRASAKPSSARLRLRSSRVSMAWALQSPKDVREFARAVEDGKRRYGARARWIAEMTSGL